MNNYVYLYLISLTLLNLYLLVKVDRLANKHNMLFKAMAQGFEDVSKWINKIRKGE